MPCVVTLTRVSPGRLDSDGVVGSMKFVRDAVARWIGVDDKHDDIVAYQYAQEHGKEYGVRVAVQKVEGVESVELSLERAQADIRLQQGNHVPLDRFRQIVKGNGFEPKEATVTASGTIRETGGKMSFEVAGVGTTLVVAPEKTPAAILETLKALADAKSPLVDVVGVVTIGKDGSETIAITSARGR
jgi:copper chaperone CopZ